MHPREIDALIAAHVMGWQEVESKSHGHYWLDAKGDLHEAPGYTPMPDYSTDIAAAWRVVEAMRGRDFYSQHTDLTLDSKTEWWSWSFTNHQSISAASVGSTANTAPMAICLAALAALGVEWLSV